MPTNNNFGVIGHGEQMPFFVKKNGRYYVRFCLKNERKPEYLGIYEDFHGYCRTLGGIFWRSQTPARMKIGANVVEQIYKNYFPDIFSRVPHPVLFTLHELAAKNASPENLIRDMKIWKKPEEIWGSIISYLNPEERRVIFGGQRFSYGKKIYNPRLLMLFFQREAAISFS